MLWRRKRPGPAGAFRVLVVLLWPGVAGTALADPQGDCLAAGGAYLAGSVVAPPLFRHGAELHGVELSHTHIRLESDQDHQVYDVAADNVFASGYDQAGGSVPSPLAQIRPGERIELCGRLYTDGSGIDWVHTNCGQTPTNQKPDGWLRLIAPDGSRGDNLEGSREYCELWGEGSR